MDKLITEEKKVDMRIIKTKRDLCNSLMAMLEVKTMEQITVQDICKNAMVNRMTFYKHYSDKYDLLSDCVLLTEKRITEEIDKKIDFSIDPVTYCINLVGTVVDICEEKRTLLKRLTLQENVIAGSVISDCIQSGIEKILIALTRGRTKYCPVEYSAAFITGGASRVVLYWLGHKENYPKEKLIEDIMPLFVTIIDGGVLHKPE